jgi:hypothetical protein
VQFLDHPILSRVSTAAWLLSLAPFVAALISAVVGRVLDQPTLFLVAVGLAMLGIVLVAITAVRQRPVLAGHSRESSTPSREGAPPPDTENQRTATFEAVEGEIALAHEETMEMAKMLRKEWPYMNPEGALVQTALPDWKDKTTDFIGAVVGSAHRAAFKGSGTGDNALERLESEGKFLSDLALKLTPDSVRANESEFLEARRKRREHQAASFLTYDHSRAPGAPAMPDDAIPAKELRQRARNAQHRGAALADLFKEGEDFRMGCTKVPEGDSAEQALWHLVGGTPQEQCGREDQAREWDEKVSGFLWADPDLKQFYPGWGPAGEPIARALHHPDQSRMNPKGLADWYQGKLDYLRSVIDKASQQ